MPAKFDRCVKSVKKRGGAANAYAVCTAATMKKKRAKNPAGASAEVFEEFHGTPSREIIKVKSTRHHHTHLAALGELKELTVVDLQGRTHHVKGFKRATLCTNEAKDQIFIEGGDQSVNPEDFGADTPHEVQTLGKVTGVVYFTDKKHLGDEGGEANYEHEFRTTNENGRHVVVKVKRYPDLIYFTRDERLEFSGGSYEIRAEGIDY